MDDRRKRIQFRAWRRGFREHDFIMGGFADAHLSKLDEANLDAFEALLGAPDQDVYSWIVGATPAPGEYDTPLLELLRTYRAFVHATWNQGNPTAQ